MFTAYRVLDRVAFTLIPFLVRDRRKLWTNGTCDKVQPESAFLYWPGVKPVNVLNCRVKALWSV